MAGPKVPPAFQMEISMPKTLLPMVASLLLCGTATAALIVTNASAGPSTETRPVMVALAEAPHLGTVMAAPPADAGAAPGMRDMRGRRGAMCGEIGARTAGRLAYLETRLDLAAAQTPLFDRWKNTQMAAARRLQDKCDARMKMDKPMRAAARTPLERLAREEEMLKARLADISAERPALQALYGSLTDEQKAEFGRGGHRMAMRMMRHGPMNGPMRGSPGMQGPAGTPPDAPPPPAPPQ
ncbi:MAG: hypothetical protein BGN85_06075 [Alphaproteobacteria bacterium 64-11]|nr:MAG: hypothetical protein BGN85_06075 [Alphaproteobacteria bacterium 64-11]